MQRLDEKINNGSLKEAGIVIFDLNDLKYINDTMGHDTGDIYIYTASMLISEFFNRSIVYRIGGDEFAVILEHDDYSERNDLLAKFNRQAVQNLRSEKVVIAAGIAEFKPGFDKSFKSVFDRADKQMYSRKKELKKLQKQIQAIC